MPWLQCNIHFSDPTSEFQVAAADLLPPLAAAQGDGHLHAWWYIRKNGVWRLRYRGGPQVVANLLDTLAADGRITGWEPGIYEPETLAFGGPQSMDVAHELFHRDSCHVLSRAAEPGPAARQRETSILLCAALMRAAGLDWYEAGDVWAQVAEHRPIDPAKPAWPPEREIGLQAVMHRLLTADARSLPALPTGWLDAFEEAGQSLASLAHQGRLQRGLRAILAHHVIFHANRAGLPVTDQSAIAALAVHTVFTPAADRIFPAQNLFPKAKVPPMTLIDDQPDVTPEELRDALTDRLVAAGTVRTPSVEAAFRTVPRHLFVPSASLDAAYGDDPIYTKHDGAGVSLSAASQPTIVGMMLEQLNAEPGQRILEAGAGTGYNAALIATIVGPQGHVTTIDVDDDLVTGARDHLAAAGIGNVTVVLADGALGHPENAPFDRFIATVGAWEVPAAWLDQLTPEGRLVVPLRLRGVASRAIVFERDENGWHSVDHQLATFMPLRGIGDDARRTVAITAERDVTLQVHKDQAADPTELAGVLDTNRVETWTEVTIPATVSYELLDLWLCLRLDNPLMRMHVGSEATTRGTVTPMFPWGSMATTSGNSLAYLISRCTAERDSADVPLYEVGVVGHGPSGAELAEHVANEIRTWNQDYRDRAVRFELPDTPPSADPGTGRFVLSRPTHPILVTWE
ncbi:methyltransferase, FxLD system [Microbispora triticiradicis]|uniref:Protein-L-isoaspartate O-methyltransferase n=2 Tax=Microbispora TaxID=2005 RepID=A0ABY3LSK0_9ACTN|nr:MULTISPECIES: methyltransferase, FxLD system [Microbispora]TLP57849.1 methyltransferase, FxLD system [Microbispora fusca]TYB52317.1 methyltransferase, FxLD system [Microbispora tritici]